MRLSILISALLVSALLTGAPAGADDAGDLRSLVDRFFATQSKKDLAAHLSLWSEQAPDLGAHRAALQKLFDQNEDIQVRRTTILKQKIERASATLQVYSEMTAAARSGKPSTDFGKRVTNFTCAKDGGGWRVVRASDAPRDLLDGLLSAKTRRERQTLLDENTVMFTVAGADLVVGLNQRAEGFARDKNLPEALRVNDLAYEVAAFLRNPSMMGACWTSRGLIYAAVNQPQEAMAQYQRALGELREAKDKVSEALTLNYMGVLQSQQGKTAEATKLFEESLQVLRSINNKPVEAVVLMNLGSTHERLENLPAALTAYENATLAVRATSDRAGEARLLVMVGNLQRRMKKDREALAQYQAAAKLYQELGNKPSEADVVLGIGAVYHQLGDKTRAAAAFESALQIVKGLNNPSLEAVTLSNLATTHEELKNYPVALTTYAAAAARFRELGNKSEESRVLVRLGNVQRLDKKLPEAQASYEAALKLKRELKETGAEADLLMGLGSVFHEQGESRKAAESFDEALKIIRGLNNKPLEALALSNLGALQDRLKNEPAALAAYEASAVLYRELKDKAGEARALVAVGNLQRTLKRPTEALATYQSALALKRELGNKQEEAGLLMSIGVLQHEAKNSKAATESFEAALALVRAEKNTRLEAVTLNNLGAIHEQLGNLPEALKAYDASVKLQRELSDKDAEARLLISIGNVQVALKKPAEALASYEAALKIRREQKDQAGEANLLIALGAMYHQQGDTKKAAATFEAALKLVRDAKKRDLEAAVLTSYAITQERLNNNEVALRSYADSAAAFHEVGDATNEARALVNLGNLQRRIGKSAEALASYESALKLKQAQKDRAGEADLQLGLGLVYYQTGHVAKATAAWEAGLSLARELGDKPRQAAAQLNLATVYEQTDGLIPALAAYDEALRLARELKDQSGELRALVGLGNVQRGLRNLGGALRSFEEGLPLATTLRDRDNEFRCRLGKALILTSQSRWAEARTEYQQCMTVLNALPLGLQLGAPRTLTVADRRALRDNLTLIALQLQSANPKPEDGALRFLEQAFTESESRRIHSFVDLTEALGVQIKEGAPAAQTAKERELALQLAQAQRDLSVLASQPGERDDKKIAELEAKQKTAEQQIKALVATLRETKYGRLRYPEPATLAEARKLLPPNAALLAYHVLPEQTILFVITKTAFASRPVTLTRTLLAQKVSALLSKLGAANSSLPELATASSELYAALVGPAAGDLKGLKRLVIIPDGPLCYLPFTALVSGKDAKEQPIYLIDEFTVSVIPSLSALVASREARPKTRPASTRMLAGFADPELAKPKAEANGAAAANGKDSSANPIETLPALQFAAGEVNAAAALFKPRDRVFLGKEASEEHAITEGATTRMLLFATPVRLGDDGLNEVGLPLTNGALSTADLLNWKLTADLVLLTGAHAVPGKLASGDGFHLLTRSVLYAGANSLTLSLWRQNDASRIKLTQGFLSAVKDQLATPGLDKAEALRTAQLKLRKAAPTAHPFHWAAFVLAGDWQ